MTQKIVTGLYIYPIKSLGGIALQEAKVEMRGLQHDRRWMLVDKEGRFISQRAFPTMALLRPEITASHLVVRSIEKEEEALEIPLTLPANHTPLNVQVWDSSCQALPVGKRQNEWFSDMLGTSCRLVYMADHLRRPVDPKYARPNEHVSFADGYPYLILGESSLADLNERLGEPVPMNRFRPNIVFSGGDPYEEDQWGTFTIGSVNFRGVKPCARCQVTTIEQDTAIVGKEPLRTLAQYRRQGNGVLFGQNVCWVPGEAGDQPGEVKVGERVETSPSPL